MEPEPRGTGCSSTAPLEASLGRPSWSGSPGQHLPASIMSTAGGGHVGELRCGRSPRQGHQVRWQLQKGLWAGRGHGGLDGLHPKKIRMSSKQSGCREPTHGGSGRKATGVTFATGSEDRSSPGQRPALLAPLLSWLGLPDKLPQAGNLKQH